MPDNIVGWDIGGAHLKAAFLVPEAKKLVVYQQPCELWKGLDRLEHALNHILAKVAEKIDQHVFTMTGELVDLFENRDDGVASILASIQRFLPGQDIFVYAGKDGFLKPENVVDLHYASIASANWLASATLAANKIKNGLFVDVGSTTTDILFLQDGQVKNQGYTDYERLISQELVYTGIIRTPLMAVAQFASDQGKKVGLMAEYFATMSDVYRLTGELDENHDQTATADGGDKTTMASAKRLARMIGCDYYDSELSRWVDLARDLKKRQLAFIGQACKRQMLQLCGANEYPLIGAGVGRFLVEQLADELAKPYIDFSSLFLGANCAGLLKPADCAPAVSVGYLASDALNSGAKSQGSHA